MAWDACISRLEALVIMMSVILGIVVGYPTLVDGIGKPGPIPGGTLVTVVGS